MESEFLYHEYPVLSSTVTHVSVFSLSATGNANRTKPEQGFDELGLDRVFANITIPVNETIPANKKIPVGAIAGGIICGIVLFIAVFFILRRRQRMMAPQQVLPQFPEMSSSTEIQELQERGLYELHDSRHVPELPSLPIELDSSVSGKCYGVSN